MISRTSRGRGYVLLCLVAGVVALARGKGLSNSQVIAKNAAIASDYVYHEILPSVSGREGRPCLRVQVAGTGSPFFNPSHAGSGAVLSYGVVKGRSCQISKRILVDAGQFVTHNLINMGVACRDLDAVLFTHDHADHIADLSNLITACYMERDAVFGPPGTPQPPMDPIVLVYPDTPEFEETINGARAFLASDRRRRLGGDSVVLKRYTFNPTGSSFNLSTVPSIAANLGPLLSTFSIEAIPSVHNADKAVGYKFTTDAGIVLLSGDTAKNSKIKDAAVGADIVIHEVMSSKEGTVIPQLSTIHTTAKEIGALLAPVYNKRKPEIILTHYLSAPPKLIPFSRITENQQPTSAAEFILGVKGGGFRGRVTCAFDGMSTTLVQGQAGSSNQYSVGFRYDPDNDDDKLSFGLTLL